MVGVHIQVFAPLHHALEDGHEALQALLPETELLEDRSDEAQRLNREMKCRHAQGSQGILQGYKIIPDMQCY